jgi:threonine-phosphate decarboxylase
LPDKATRNPDQQEPEVPQHVHGGDILGTAARYGLNPGKIIDFSANINPLGPPPAVYEAIQANLPKIVHYPDPRCGRLTAALSQYFQVPQTQIICGNGASELIFLLLAQLSPRVVLLPVPSFSEYEIAARVAGAEVRYLPLDPEKNFVLAPRDLEQAVAGVDLVFLCSPNNPVGNQIAGESLAEVIQISVARGAFTVVDESFLDFVPRWRQLTSMPQVGPGQPLFVLRSLTKFFGLPGLRLGSGVGGPDLVEALYRRKDPWSVNLLAQAAGVAALGDEEYREQTRRQVGAERERQSARLQEIPGIKPYPAEANFQLLDISQTGQTATAICDSLARRGILVRNCNTFPTLGEDYIRVAVRTRPENDQLLEALREACGETPPKPPGRQAKEENGGPER